MLLSFYALMIKTLPKLRFLLYALIRNSIQTLYHIHT